MQRIELTEKFEKLLEKRNLRGKIVSIAHVKELQEKINDLHEKDLLDEELYDAYLASFDFECRQDLPNAGSLVIVSVPQPQVRVTFVLENRSHPVIIPPTYFLSTDNQVAHLLGTFFEPLGFELLKVRLPQKLLAVGSGLARYGRNNITYVAGMGSFHRPVVFVSDCPAPADSWRKPALLAQCETCHVCMKACPTRAIAEDRFLLHAERCITFHNERTNDFPDWWSPAWHRCLVGCMICQKVCPANKDFVGWIEGGSNFDEEETALLLEGTPEDSLPAKTLDKLERLGMMEYLNVIGRNLKALLNKPA
jgi:epoxyqueuosine reductase